MLKRLRQVGSSPWMTRSVVLGLTLFSGVAFTLSSFTARLFAKQALTNILDFQTSTVFLAFIVQSGLRAGMRNQHHLGRKRLVVQAERKLLRVLPAAAALISAALWFQHQFVFFPAYCFLHAALTLLIGLRIAQGRSREAVIHSILTFVSILAPCLLIMFSGKQLVDLRLPIEAGAIVWLTALSIGKRPSPLSARALKQVFVTSLGMQLGAFGTYLFVFLLGRYIVSLSRAELAVAVAFADVQVLCGVQSMLFSRIFLFFEGRLIREQKAQFLSLCLLAWTFALSLGVFGIVRVRHDSLTATLYAALTLSVMGREPLGVIFQFMRDRYRLESLLVTAAACAGLLIAMYGEARGLIACVYIALFSPATISLLMAARALGNSSFYLSPSAVEA